mmetsp:Transcript_38769/g.81515  ORF Transcript_38769/g.81515 Transcript_38769/m.81515 type:complete len:293 (-) Transcript_38769:202-1080(-)
MHLLPKRRLLIFHAHNAIGQLGNKQSRNGDLTSKCQLKRKLGGIHGIDMVSMVIFTICHGSIHRQGHIVRSPSITQIIRLIRTPRTTLGITHGNATSLGSPHGRAISPKALVALQWPEGLAFGFLEVHVGVVRVAASLAFLAGEGRDARSGVDDDGLTLGIRGSHPEVDVVGAVSLVEGSHLLLQGAFVIVFVFGAKRGNDGFVIGRLGMARGVWSRGQGEVQLLGVGAVFLMEFTTTAIEVCFVRDQRMGYRASFGVGQDAMLIMAVSGRLCCGIGIDHQDGNDNDGGKHD